ncbi:MAG: ABC transporter permease [Armatimonadota bacterium]|nr:ABC transporter permease [Armatimonadota bacterium]MDR7511549.1 ABC transporter permease [Armatimonadota bacterium]
MAARELWRSRELVHSLVERDLRAQYKQAVLGVAWAVVTPLAFMVVFSVFFRRVATVDTQGIPYPLFSYVGVVPWTFFSSAVTRGGLSLLSNAALLNRVYCPREVFPLAGVISAGIDTLVALAVLGILFALSGVAPRPTSVLAPMLVLTQLAFTVGVTLTVAALVVYFRDLRHALSLVLQFGVLATPVAYGLEVIPRHLQVLYGLVNPLGPVIDGYRRVILFGQTPQWETLAPAVLASCVWLVGAFVLFKKLEVGFADVV